MMRIDEPETVRVVPTPQWEPLEQQWPAESRPRKPVETPAEPEEIAPVVVSYTPAMVKRMAVDESLQLLDETRALMVEALDWMSVYAPHASGMEAVDALDELIDQVKREARRFDLGL